MSEFNPNPKSENPYATPISSQAYNPGGPYAHGAYPPHDSFPQQVPVIGILMIVQGCLELLMGLFLLGMAVFFPVMLAMEQGVDGPGDPPMWLFLAIYGVMGLAVAIPGVLRIFAGFSAYRFRRRMLAIVTNCVGFMTVFTCYCAPTAIALGVYSLIVFLQPSVVHAFAQNAASSGAKAQ